jgi:hypothetical protein
MSCEVEVGFLDMNGCDLVAPILLPPRFVLALPHACPYDFVPFCVHHVKSVMLKFSSLCYAVHKYCLNVLGLKDGVC